MSDEVISSLGLQIAKQIRRLRLEKKWSREELAERSQINVYTLKHFERFGQISLDRLLKICQNLGLLEDIVRAFKPRQRVSIDEWALPAVTSRQRGQRRQVKVTAAEISEEVDTSVAHSSKMVL